MGVTFKFGDGEKIGTRFKNRTKQFSERMIKATQSAAFWAKNEILVQGRANIRAGGDFGSARWQEGLQARLSWKSRSDINIRVTHAVSYWRVFEYGATIRGRPMLWIPLPFATDAQGVMARDYPYYLFKIERLGKAPLLMTHDGEPKYFGKESVRIPKKWDLREIVKKVSRQMDKQYKKAMKESQR